MRTTDCTTNGQTTHDTSPLELTADEKILVADLLSATSSQEYVAPAAIMLLGKLRAHDDPRYAAIRQYAQTHGLMATVPGPLPDDPQACPPLPAKAQVDPHQAEDASPWLSEYIAFSRRWAPRAYDDFHELTGLFVLATTAARRIAVPLGARGVYPSFYGALAATTSLFTKTTVVDLGEELLRRAGLGFLLADDDATPQAFLRSLTRQLPPNFDTLDAEAQQEARQQAAFSAQRGWFYEEWGQHITAMMQKDGPMAAFRSILRRLDDHRERYRSQTIGRGRDVLSKPYLTLLANITPADLRPFARATSPLWRDGYLARFVFCTPAADAPISTAPFPQERVQYPARLLADLHAWHTRLGVPEIALGADNRITVQRDLPETVYPMSPAVFEAFYAYDTALRGLLMPHPDRELLAGSYARLPTHALRMAALLTSLHAETGGREIPPAAWARGQQLAEARRRDLHRLLQQVEQDVGQTETAKREDRFVRLLRRAEQCRMTQNEIRRATGWSLAVIADTGHTLAEAHVVTEEHTTRGKRFTLNGISQEF